MFELLIYEKDLSRLGAYETQDDASQQFPVLSQFWVMLGIVGQNIWGTHVHSYIR